VGGFDETLGDVGHDDDHHTRPGTGAKIEPIVCGIRVADADFERWKRPTQPTPGGSAFHDARE